MKNLFFSLLVFTASMNAFANSVVSSQKLELGDSTRLYKGLGLLGHTAKPDVNDPSTVIHKSGFSSSDGAFKIQCVNKTRGVDLGTECDVIVDSSLSENGISSVAIGAVGEVIIINLFSDLDVKSIQRSVAKPLGYFQASEVVQVTLPDGKVASFPRLKMDCISDKEICQIALFPR